MDIVYKFLWGKIPSIPKGYITSKNKNHILEILIDSLKGPVFDPAFRATEKNNAFLLRCSETLIYIHTFDNN